MSHHSSTDLRFSQFLFKLLSEKLREQSGIELTMPEFRNFLYYYVTSQKTRNLDVLYRGPYIEGRHRGFQIDHAYPIMVEADGDDFVVEFLDRDGLKYYVKDTSEYHQFDWEVMKHYNAYLRQASQERHERLMKLIKIANVFQTNPYRPSLGDLVEAKPEFTGNLPMLVGCKGVVMRVAKELMKEAGEHAFMNCVVAMLDRDGDMSLTSMPSNMLVKVGHATDGVTKIDMKEWCG